LVSAVVVVGLIGVTTMERGLVVRCVLDEARYECGLEVRECRKLKLTLPQRKYVATP